MTWDQVIEAATKLGFPAAAFFALMWLGNKWAAEIVKELRLFRDTMERTTRGIELHVTERAAYVIREVGHDVRAAIGPLLPGRDRPL